MDLKRHMLDYLFISMLIDKEKERDNYKTLIWLSLKMR